MDLFIKTCIFILTWFNFSHFQSTLNLIQCTYQHIFSTAQNSFWTRRLLCLLVLLPFFVSPLPHQQNISLWGLLSSRETNKQKSLWWDQVNEGVGLGIIPFLVKSSWILHTSCMADYIMQKKISANLNMTQKLSKVKQDKKG